MTEQLGPGEDDPRRDDILENISEAIYALDREWHLVYVNRNAERLWGRRREDLLGKDVWEAFPEAVGTYHHEQHLRAVREGRPIRFEAISPVLGRWVETHVCPSGTGLIVYFHDISERKQVEEERERLLADEQELLAEAELANAALRESRRRLAILASEIRGQKRTFEALLNSSPDIIFTLDAQGRISYVNRAAREALMFSSRRAARDPGAILGRTLHDLGLAESFVVPFAANFARAMGGETAVAQSSILTRHGLRTFEYILSPIFHDNGAVEAVAGIGRDVDERERLLGAERAARAEAEAASRTRDEVLSSVSHDLRGPLGSIKGYAQFLQREMAGTRETDLARWSEMASRIDHAATTMTAMIDDIVDVARVQMGRPLELHSKPTDLTALARRIVEVRQPAVPDHPLRVTGALGPLVGTWDPVRLERAIANLIDNAVKYSATGTIVTVDLRREDEAGTAWAVIRVADRGIGIPEADLPRVFVRFQRGANVPSDIAGNGIGLATVKQIVEQHRGTIDLASIVGKGTTVTVRLPLGS